VAAGVATIAGRSGRKKTDGAIARVSNRWNDSAAHKSGAAAVKVSQKTFTFTFTRALANFCAKAKKAQ